MAHANVMCDELADALAFVGNSFLKPMSQLSDVGLDHTFWAAFPDFGNEGVASALERCFQWAASGESVSRDERVKVVSVEYARLFIGPPEPIVAPWETFYEREGVVSGFGEPTFRMRERLRQLDLVVSNENNQYEDHIGIELLCCSEYVRRAVGDPAFAKEARAFAADVLVSLDRSIRHAVGGILRDLLSPDGRTRHGPRRASHHFGMRRLPSS